MLHRGEIALSFSNKRYAYYIQFRDTHNSERMKHFIDNIENEGRLNNKL